MIHYMAFQTHAALALSLIALVSGVLLLNKASTTEFFCKKTGKVLGGLVVILSLLSTLCILYLSIRSCCHKGEMTGWQHPPMGMPGEGQTPPSP